MLMGRKVLEAICSFFNIDIDRIFRGTHGSNVFLNIFNVRFAENEERAYIHLVVSWYTVASEVHAVNT